MRRAPALLTSAVTTAALVAGPVGGAGAAADEFSRPQSLFFQVEVGPTSDPQRCSLVADLYVPDGVDRRHKAPALLMTNGFGGSKEGFSALAPYLAERGYVVLAYSGLGFGGSGCKIYLDDPDYDGRAASALIGYLGGETGHAFLDSQHRTAAPALRIVQRDRRDHRGVRRPHDPRVGMYGGSYGGAVQFAAASVDSRLDTIVPIATWNDLRYALAPNNVEKAGRLTTTPGATKLLWGVGFSAVGVAGGVTRAPDDPNRVVGCPNFADFVCPALVSAGTTGFFQAEALAALEHASVSSYMRRVHIPTLLVQGQYDTLFNLNEAVRTYRALRTQGTPVSMIWQYGGHSAPTAPGEIDETAPAPNQYVLDRVLRWYDHHLRRSGRGTGPGFAYFRDWVPYQGSARPAYATMPRYRPAGHVTTYLSGDGLLTADPGRARPETLQFTTPAAGAPSTVNPLDLAGGFETPWGDHVDAPGTFASWTGAALRKPMTVVGSPRLRLRLAAPTAAHTQAGGAAGQLVLFPKLVDVAPDGTATTLKQLEAPVRIADVTKPFTVRFPAVVHRFARDHRVRLVVAGGSGSYRGGLTASPVGITGGQHQRLTIPVEN